jgi:hypothetical protein
VTRLAFLLAVLLAALPGAAFAHDDHSARKPSSAAQEKHAASAPGFSSSCPGQSGEGCCCRQAAIPGQGAKPAMDRPGARVITHPSGLRFIVLPRESAPSSTHVPSANRPRAPPSSS